MRSTAVRSSLSATTLLLPLALTLPAWSAEPTTRLVSRGLLPVPRSSSSPSVSADGRYVAFQSEARLTSEDTNNVSDIYVRDRQASTTVLVSVGIAGAAAISASYNAAISADGRFVAFDSFADNLVPGDANGHRDVFLRDLYAGTTSLVSLSSGGAQADGRAYDSSISADGRFILYTAEARSLVADSGNTGSDLYLRDMQEGTTVRVVHTSTGDPTTGGNAYGAISTTGRYIAFVSVSPDLVGEQAAGAFLLDRESGLTTLVSVPISGTLGRDVYLNPCVSPDGRYVAFTSSSTDLVPNDTNGYYDVFLRDSVAGTTERISIGNDGAQANQPSDNASISADGRFLAFFSLASNLISSDNNYSGDIFVRDRQIGTTTRVSVKTGGIPADKESQHPSVTPDGRFVVFDSAATNIVTGDTNGAQDVFVRDTLSVKTERVSLTNAGEQSPQHVIPDANADCGGANVAAGSKTLWAGKVALSRNGATVAYFGYPSNVIAGEQIADYINDLSTGVVCSVKGFYAISLSADGLHIAYEKYASPSPIEVRDLANGVTAVVSVRTDGSAANGNHRYPTLSADARFVAFESNSTEIVPGVSGGIFVRNLMAANTLVVPGTEGGIGHFPAISADGSHVAWVTGGTTRDVFVTDLRDGTAKKLTPYADTVNALDGMTVPAVSRDGRYVAFASRATDLVPNDTNGKCDVFVCDTVSGTITRVSVSSSGEEGNGDSPGTSGTFTVLGGGWPTISSDGRYVAFVSSASNLVANDTNATSDAFIHDTVHHTTTRVSVRTDGSQSTGWTSYAAISGNGAYVAFVTPAALVPDLTYTFQKVYLRGPLIALPPPVTIADLLAVLGATAGLAEPDAATVARLDVAGGGSLDLADAVVIARRVAGLDLNAWE